MAKAKIRHTYNCSEETFWSEIFFSKEFNRKLFLEHLGFKKWEILRFDESDDTIVRELENHPVTGELPAALAKVIGDNIGFREKGTYDKTKRRYRFKITPNRLANKLSISGEIHVEPRGEERCERIVDLEVVAKVFGLGGMIEKRIIADTEDSFRRGFEFAQTQLKGELSSKVGSAER